MKQLTKEMKSVLTTWYNVDHRKNEETQYWIDYGYPTFSSTYVCNIYEWGDILLCKIKYKRHDGIEEDNIREWYTDDKEIKKTIKTAWKRYA